LKKYLILSVFLSLLLTYTAYAQKASDYFPSASGFKWFYKTIPFDSLNNSIDSLSFVTIDSLAGNQDFQGRSANVILQKNGAKDSILVHPYLDSNYVALDSVDIWNYTTSLPGMGAFGIGIPDSAKKWYSVYRLSQKVNSSYSIFTMDTTLILQGMNTILTFTVKGKRIQDQNIYTALGNLLCKKFILTIAITAKVSIFPIPIPITTVTDTAYIAPGYYIVKDVRPSANADLSKFGLPSFFVPGSKMDIFAPPAVLDVNPKNIFTEFSVGDTSFSVSNLGSDTLRWNAAVIAGTSWLHLLDTMGVGDALIRFTYSSNPDTALRIGLIFVSDTNAWGTPQIIKVTQGHYLTSIKMDNKLPVQFKLSQNFPNPFNPSTIIKYCLPQNSFVKLNVYNSLGQEVASLVNGFVNAGTYNIQFNASYLSSGVYFYVIRAGNNYTQTNKMILLR
jgi:Secretion system C-terminal sorting domain